MSETNCLPFHKISYLRLYVYCVCARVVWEILVGVSASSGGSSGKNLSMHEDTDMMYARTGTLSFPPLLPHVPVFSSFCVCWHDHMDWRMVVMLKFDAGNNTLLATQGK